jgi:Fe2+ or Zn2+ uptake regulation protein
MSSEEKVMPGKKLVDFEKIFRVAGLKMTHQRMMICREILTAGDHLEPRCQSLTDFTWRSLKECSQMPLQPLC